MRQLRTISAENLNNSRVALLQAIACIAKYVRLSVLLAAAMPALFLLMAEPGPDNWAVDFLWSKITGIAIFSLIFVIAKRWSKKNLLPEL